MFAINFNPILLKIGFLEIRWYSLIYALGFVIFYLFLREIAKKKLIERLDKEKAELFVIYSIIGVVLGARIFYFLFYDINELFTNPSEFFKIWNAGLSFHGGLFGFLASSWIFSRREKINFWSLIDISSVAAIFALMLGRIGNLINGELAGTEFSGPWCAVFPLYDNLCRHPYPVYAFISHMMLFFYLAVLLYVNRKRLKDFIGKKIIAANFLIGYGVLRIITDIWKLDSMFLFMKTGQWLSAVMIVLGVFLLVWKKKKA